jgi:hypothetical protein
LKKRGDKEMKIRTQYFLVLILGVITVGIVTSIGLNEFHSKEKGTNRGRDLESSWDKRYPRLFKGVGDNSNLDRLIREQLNLINDEISLDDDDSDDRDGDTWVWLRRPIDISVRNESEDNWGEITTGWLNHWDDVTTGRVGDKRVWLDHWGDVTTGRIGGERVWLNHWGDVTTGRIGGERVWLNHWGDVTTGRIGGERVWLNHWGDVTTGKIGW